MMMQAIVLFRSQLDIDESLLLVTNASRIFMSDFLRILLVSYTRGT